MTLIAAHLNERFIPVVNDSVGIVSLFLHARTFSVTITRRLTSLTNYNLSGAQKRK